MHKNIYEFDGFYLFADAQNKNKKYKILFKFIFIYIQIYKHKMNKRTLLLLIILVIEMSALTCSRVQHHTEQEKLAYLNSLIQIENQLKSDANQLQDLVNNVQSTANEQRGSDQAQGTTIQEGLKEQKQLLEKMNQNIIIPIDQKSYACRDLSDEEKQKTDQQIQEKQRRLDQINAQIESEGQCAASFKIKAQAQYLSLFIDHLEKTKVLCAKQTPTVYKLVNPDSNFAYGDLDEDQYNDKVEQYKELGYLTVQCPQNSPFPFEGQCASCGQDQIFDVSKNMCFKCPDGFIFFKENHQCIQQVFNNNPSAPNYYGPVPSKDVDSETCPKATPFFDGQDCIECELPQYFSYQSLTCNFCDDGFVFNLQSKKCGYEQFNSNLGPYINYCCQGEEGEFNPNIQTCPQDRPFFNGVQCIQCDLPSYFSLEQKRCLYCQEGEGFSLKNNQCVDAANLKPVYKPSIDEDNEYTQNYMGTPHVIPGKYQNVISCDDDKPYSTGDKCIKCESPSYFNFNTELCEVCPAESAFSLDDHKCVFIPTGDEFNTNLVGLKNYQGEVPEFNENLKTCPENEPFFDGDSCIGCSLPQFVDFDTDSCKYCPDDKHFNILNRQCEVQYHSFYTDSEAPNIFYNGNYEDVEEQIQKRKQKSPTSQQCPQSKPFFNALQNKCIICPDKFILFDFKYNRCMKCSGESTYTEETHVCMSNGSVSPTLERMIMNTFGWI